MDPKETSKPIRGARTIDAVAKRAAATSPAASEPPTSISRDRRSKNVIDLRQVADKPKAAPKPAEKPAPKPKPEPKTSKPEPVKSDLPLATGSAPKRKFWPAFGRFIVLLLVLAALVAGAYYVYITYYRT